MPVIPSFILKKVYVSGSLRNVGEGCQLQIKNTLAPVTIIGVGPVVFDGVAHGPASVVLVRGEERLAASDASKTHPLAFALNVVVTVIVENVTLGAGVHRIGLDVNSKEAGRLKVEFSDTLSS